MRHNDDSTPRTVQEVIVRICESEQAREKLRMAGAPEIGIFWVIDNEPLIDGTPLNEAREYLDVFPLKSHSETWPSFQRIGIVPPNSKYEDYPRGRVVYDKKHVHLPFLPTNVSCRTSKLSRRY